MDESNVLWHLLTIIWPTKQTGLIARLLSRPAKTFLGYCFGGHYCPCFSDSPFPGQPPFWLISHSFSFFCKLTLNVHWQRKKKFVPSLQICFPITLSPTHRSPLLSAREILGRHRGERIFILTLLIRKELNLSGNSRSLFSFRHTVKSILRSDCKSCKISLSFQGSFSPIL